MPIEDFFRGEDGESGNHPLLRFLSVRVKAGDKATFELRRPREVLGYTKARIYVHLFRNGQEVDCKDDDWDDDLNTGLIHLEIRSGTLDEEKDRFALGLRAALRKPEMRYGDGYFNAVFVKFVAESDFRVNPEVAEVLPHVRHVGPPHEGKVYADCVEMIDGAIRGRGTELVKYLKYEMHEAVDILAGALARYLDERFSVTNRRLLGLL